MARRPARKLSKKEEKAQKKAPHFEYSQKQPNDLQVDDESKEKFDAPKIVIQIPKIITVREFSSLLGLPVPKVIIELMKNGVMASINESIDFDTASIVGDELGYEIKVLKEDKKQKKELSDEEKASLVSRPPVVVVMGHVDHGKTTLLDAIRKTNVAGGESGGITQHIGAYQVHWKNKDKKDNLITFLDTPGHEAFSAMRAHGANITDIVILVVAADDGVKPQTKEAISHAKAAGVPIIVAINKIDKPEADPERVKRELADLELIPEEWGGSTVMVPISAKTGKGVNELLDMVLVVAELENLQANPNKNPEGVVIESYMQPGVGPIATILIQEGTIKVGQIVLIGNTFGKVRLLEDYQGKRITEAGPATPIRVAGLHDVPGFGELVQVVNDERTARTQIASKSIRSTMFGLAQVSEEVKAGKLDELNLIIKTDVQGSMEAIKNSLEPLGNETVKVKIISAGIGPISESDINMAVASTAVVIGFRVSIPPVVKKLADEKGVKISMYDIIYNLIDDVSAALQGMLKPEIIEETIGKVEVLKVFYSTRTNKIIGGKVIDGKIQSGLKVHLTREGEKYADGKMITLKMEQNPVSEVLKGFECGLGIDVEKHIKPGDIIEVYKTEEIFKKIK